MSRHNCIHQSDPLNRTARGGIVHLLICAELHYEIPILLSTPAAGLLATVPGEWTSGFQQTSGIKAPETGYNFGVPDMLSNYDSLRTADEGAGTGIC